MVRKTAIVVASLTFASCLFGGSDPVGQKNPNNASADAGSDVTVNDVEVNDVASNNVAPDVGPPDNDVAVPTTCGDGALQANEACDPELPADSAGACPTSCDDGEVCTTDSLVGAPETCDAACSSVVIDTCVDDDGCCPGDCAAADDNDCTDTVVCGDGVVSGAETCDPGIASGPGACPRLADCPAGACQVPRLLGSPTTCDATCAGTPITSCTSGDGCCAAGCDSSNDSDCMAMCGNGTIEAGELCDGNCPTDCDDNQACTTDMLQGSDANCDAECVNTPINACIGGDSCCPSACTSDDDNDCSATCGDGVLDVGETCDPASTCPTSCDDNNACTIDSATGSASNCNVSCTHTLRTSCGAADGCCPSGCTANSDPDCAATCGNSAVEFPETCDQNCPASCNDQNACTTDTSTGSAANCDLQCSNVAITMCVGGDGCCPTSCNATNDSDCGAVCGNGITESGELCDGNCPASCNDNNACTNDVRSGTAAQCNVSCSYTNKTMCVNSDGCCPGNCNATNDNDCSASCDNGVTEQGETCDGNCPTQATCNALGPCQILTGSANACTAECVTKAGCVECDRNGVCPCADGEECVGGVCEDSNGDGCTNACDSEKFCNVWGDAGWVCDQNDGFCKECLEKADCGPAQTCVGNSCVVASSCDGANAPNAWCTVFGQGTQCDLNTGTCFVPCTTASNCPRPESGCYNGVCDYADNCGEASDGGAWCQNQGFGDVCVGSFCYYGCPGGTGCNCPEPALQECVTSPGGTKYCDEQIAASCTDVCSTYANAYCVMQYGPGAFCGAVSMGDLGDGCANVSF